VFGLLCPKLLDAHDLEAQILTAAETPSLAVTRQRGSKETLGFEGEYA